MSLCGVFVAQTLGFRAHRRSRSCCGVTRRDHTPCALGAIFFLIQDERFRAAAAGRSSSSSVVSAQSQLALARKVGGTVLELLVQLCGGDGGAVVVGMMSQACPAGEFTICP